MGSWRRANGLIGSERQFDAAEERYRLAISAASNDEEILQFKKKRAHRHVLRAIRLGDLIPTLLCEECGGSPDRKDQRALDAHHHNGYEDAHILDVKWLCGACHIRAHPARGPKQHNNETKTKIGQSLAKSYASGHRERKALTGADNSFFGKTHSAETKQKMRKPKPRVKCSICGKITVPRCLYIHGCEVPLVAGRRDTKPYYIT